MGYVKRERHKYRLMRPCSKNVDQLSGTYPDSVNTAIARYLRLMSDGEPGLSTNEWDLIFQACDGWLIDFDFNIELLQSALISQVSKFAYLRNTGIIEKLSSFSLLQLMAVLYRIERFWSVKK